MRQGRLTGLVALAAAASLTACAGSATPGRGHEPTPASSQTRTTAPPPSPSTTATTGQSRSPTSTPPASTTPTTTPSGIPARLLGREISVIPTGRHVVALTFDAGANDAGLASIVSTLRRTGTPATFFVTGTWVRSYPAQARTVGQEFRVGDHSVTHPHFTDLSAAQISAEVLGGAAAIRVGCRQNPAPLFRFPFGDRDARTIAAVNALGYIPIGWTVDTLGWQGTSAGRSTASVLARVIDNAQPGEIVLMHVGSHPTDGSTLDADALPQIIERLHAAGYTFVTLDAVLAP